MICHPFHVAAARRRGAVTVLVAVCLVVLIAIVAIAVDGGMLLDEKRRTQAAADAAALAGATQLYSSSLTNKGKDTDGKAKASALAIAAANGYNNDGTSNVVTVRVAGENYFSGPKAGQTIPDGYVEVTILSHPQRYFSTISESQSGGWDMDQGPLGVVSRAVARGQFNQVGEGIILLDLNDGKALNAHGNGQITVTGTAKVVVNSDGSKGGGGDAAYAGNNTTMYSQGGFAIYGSVNNSSKFTGGPLSKLANPVVDPLAYLQPPTGLPNQSLPPPVNLSGGYKQYTLNPGKYSGGLSFSGKTHVILNPGIYHMDAGGFSFSGQGSLTAVGVMIYNNPTSNSQKIDVSGQGAVTWTPPTTGPYAGIAIFQNKTADVPINIVGNGQMNITGTFYAANAPVMVNGNGDTSIGSQYISRVLDVGGNGSLNINYNAAPKPGQRVIQLVE